MVDGAIREPIRCHEPFRRYVVRRPDKLPYAGHRWRTAGVDRLRDAPVEQPGVIGIRSRTGFQENVGRFHVAVAQSLAVCGVQRCGDLLNDGHRSFQ